MSDDAKVWAERYRPNKIVDCILPQATKKMVQDAIASGNIPHLLLSGSAGTGKTTMARAIANELGADMLYLNCSLDSSIDHIRSSVVSFSSSVSLSGGSKIVLLDEIDGLSSQAMNSLKGVVEEFSNTRFFATTNSLSKVIDPLKSRCLVVEFTADSVEKPKMAIQMFKRTLNILDKENIEYDKKVVAEIVNKFFPDFRRTLNEMQRYAVSGKIDSGILLSSSKATFKELVKALSDKDFSSMRKWVGENADMDPSQLYRDFYDNAYEYFETASLPQMILLLGKYQYQACFSVDQTINTATFLTEIMINCDFKEA